MNDKQIAISELNTLMDICSPEPHEHAEKILCELLIKLDHSEVVDAFMEAKERCDFWYE